MIYITGANGWLGLNLIDSIISGRTEQWGLKKKQINALILPGTDKKKILNISKEVKIYEGDITDVGSIEKFLSSAKNSIIFHLAGIIHPIKVTDFFRVNEQGTKNLMDCAIRSSIKKMIIMSSNSPCGCNKDHRSLFDEKSTYNPYMNYGKSKMKMEIIANNYFSKGLLDLTIIRSPWFYGPFQPKRQKIFFDMIKNGKGPIVGDGSNLRSMAYTENIVQGLALASNNKIASGKTYWIADNRPYTMTEIINTIEDLLIKKFNIKCNCGRLKLPFFVSEIAEKIDFTLQKFGLYHQKIHVLSEMNKNIACSIDLAKAELGYRPDYSLKEGMLKSLKEVYH